MYLQRWRPIIVGCHNQLCGNFWIPLQRRATSATGRVRKTTEPTMQIQSSIQHGWIGYGSVFNPKVTLKTRKRLKWSCVPNHWFSTSQVPNDCHPISQPTKPKFRTFLTSEIFRNWTSSMNLQRKRQLFRLTSGPAVWCWGDNRLHLSIPGDITDLTLNGALNIANQVRKKSCYGRRPNTVKRWGSATYLQRGKGRSSRRSRQVPDK